MGLSSSKSFWWHRHLAGATHRLEACATEFEFLFFSTRFCFKPVELPKKLVHFLVAAYGPRCATKGGGRDARPYDIIDTILTQFS
jgi:hypothetical protein